jgi:solute carrier family 6 amino acid transporter-like protein 5/7/9/14
MSKVVYFTATIPNITLLTLLIRTMTLEGASEGIINLFTLEIKHLSDASLWYDAAMQVMYTTGLCAGTLIFLGSYNRSSDPYLSPCIVITVVNVVSSILSAMVVFATIGVMAKTKNKTFEDVLIIDSGPGLSFKVYAMALLTMSEGPFWPLLFFTTLILLGIPNNKFKSHFILLKLFFRN